MDNFEKELTAPMGELDDDMLETVTGGASVGDVVNIRSSRIDYCKGCGKLLTNYHATITGVRGVLDGHTVYWVKHNCCGYRTSVIETSIV